jgi:hypothetical protein
VQQKLRECQAVCYVFSLPARQSDALAEYPEQVATPTFRVGLSILRIELKDTELNDSLSPLLFLKWVRTIWQNVAC